MNFSTRKLRLAPSRSQISSILPLLVIDSVSVFVGPTIKQKLLIVHQRRRIFVATPNDFLNKTNCCLNRVTGAQTAREVLIPTGQIGAVDGTENNAASGFFFLIFRTKVTR